MRARAQLQKLFAVIVLATLSSNLASSVAEARINSSGANNADVTLAATDGANITIYNQNRGLVKETHSFDLNKGVNHIDWSNLAPTIDIHSVSLRSATGEKPIEVKEQSYQHDLINSRSILSRCIGKTVYLKRFLNDGRSEEQAGILVGSPSNPYDCVLKVGDRYVLDLHGQIEVSEIPSELVAQPKLSFEVKSAEHGQKNLVLSYETSNLNWQGDYNLILNNNHDKFDLTAWITLTNQCGLSFKNAKLKLIAGNVQTNNPMPLGRVMYAAATSSAEAAFAGYHLYTWPVPVDINNNETKMLTLLERKDVPLVKKYIFDREYYVQSDPEQKLPVQMKLEFLNDEQNKQPLPGGQVKIYQEDADNELQLIGEDRIKHTPIGENISIKLGEAFDVIGERTRVNVEQISTHRRKDTYKVSFNNHLNKDISIIDVEHVPDMAIFTPDSPFTKKNSNTYQRDVKVPANGSAEVNYSIEYQV